MITSTPVNLKDIADIKFVQESRKPSEFLLALGKLKQRVADEALVNYVARQHGYTECPNAAAPQFASVERNATGKTAVFHNNCIIGHFKLINGQVWGIVREGDMDMFGNTAYRPEDLPSVE